MSVRYLPSLFILICCPSANNHLALSQTLISSAIIISNHEQWSESENRSQLCFSFGDIADYVLGIRLEEVCECLVSGTISSAVGEWRYGQSVSGDRWCLEGNNRIVYSKKCLGCDCEVWQRWSGGGSWGAFEYQVRVEWIVKIGQARHQKWWSDGRD